MPQLCHTSEKKVNSSILLIVCLQVDSFRLRSPKAGMIGMTGAAGVTAEVLAMCGQPNAIAYRHASLACDMVGMFLQCSNPP